MPRSQGIRMARRYHPLRYCGLYCGPCLSANVPLVDQDTFPFYRTEDVEEERWLF